MAIVSIQFAATIINGAGAEVVSMEGGDFTNFSVYLRNDVGTVVWDSDYGASQYSSALCKAGALSMKHSVHIEQIK